MNAAVGMPCPVCKVPLVMSDRQGVEIDYCPQCRGVWLDRGELDKIIERSAAAELPPQPAPAPAGAAAATRRFCPARLWYATARLRSWLPLQKAEEVISRRAVRLKG